MATIINGRISIKYNGSHCLAPSFVLIWACGNASPSGTQHNGRVARYKSEHDPVKFLVFFAQPSFYLSRAIHQLQTYPSSALPKSSMDFFLSIAFNESDAFDVDGPASPSRHQEQSKLEEFLDTLPVNEDSAWRPVTWCTVA